MAGKAQAPAAGPPGGGLGGDSGLRRPQGTIERIEW
jgi:hypothetical protein